MLHMLTPYLCYFELLPYGCPAQPAQIYHSIGIQSPLAGLKAAGRTASLNVSEIRPQSVPKMAPLLQPPVMQLRLQLLIWVLSGHH